VNFRFVFDCRRAAVSGYDRRRRWSDASRSLDLLLLVDDSLTTIVFSSTLRHLLLLLLLLLLLA